MGFIVCHVSCEEYFGKYLHHEMLDKGCFCWNISTHAILYPLGLLVYQMVDQSAYTCTNDIHYRNKLTCATPVSISD